MSEGLTCATTTEFGDCVQPPGYGGLCYFHWNAKTQPNFDRDLHYEEKLVAGTLGTSEWIRPAEENALFWGRRRWDGRRIDLWTIGVGEDYPLVPDPSRHIPGTLGPTW